MKRLPLVILLAVVALVAVVTGCGGARYDSRLAAADSLMHDAPDSALALVEAVSPASLTTDGDRAYRDLLLTQARYRCYITATSDSDINRALDYYRRHSGEREKLTRAYIYKGAVMEELGLPDSAMLYYKHAEANAAPDDYFNLGYIKFRIAELYQNQVSQDSAAITRLQDAIQCFTLSQDTSLMISALGSLGAICGDLYPDSAILYLHRAVQLAEQYNPILQYSPKSTLAGILLFQKEYDLAKKLALDIIQNGSEFCNETQYYYYAAMSYIKLGQIDSAKIIMRMTPAPVDAVDSLAFYNLTAELARIEGNHQLYSDNLAHSKSTAIQILSSSKEGELIQEESNFIQSQEKEHNKIIRKHNSLLILLVSCSVILIVIISTIALRLNTRNNSIKKETEILKGELEQTITRLKQQKEAADESVSELVSLRMSAIQELYRDIRIKSTDDEKVKKVISLSSLMKSLSEKRLLMDLKLKNSFWEKMRLSVDGEFNGIVTFVEKNYPDLSTDDINLFCLLCAKMSPQIIRLCMNFDNAKTVTNYRSKIIKKKMGLDMSFDEFVKKYMDRES